MEEVDWSKVILFDYEDGYTLKWDPSRPFKKWTALGPKGSLGDFYLRVEAVIAINQSKENKKE